MQPIHPIRYALILLSFSMLATSLYAQDPNAPEAEPVTAPSEGTVEPVSDPNAPLSLLLNFQDASLQAVLEYLSDKAGLVILADEPLVGSMTVISRQPLCLDEAISLINSVLKENGLAAVRMGRTLRVVTLDKAIQSYLPVTSGDDPNAITPGDDMVTHIIPVRYADVTKLKENLTPLLPEYATLEANEDGNALIVTDTTANIRRLMQIIRALDTHMSQVAEIKVFRLTSADATTTAELINKVFAEDTSASSSSNRTSGRTSGRGGRGGGGPMEMMMRMRGGGDNSSNQGGSSTSKATGKVTAVGDERTNSVVVRGPDEALALAAEVIKSLDTSSADFLDVKVVQLRYADADNVADLVNEVFGKDRDTDQQNQGRGGVMFMRGGPPMQGGNSSGDSGGSLSEVVAASDDRTNSVVVTGPTEMLDIIADVIKDLDSPNSDIADVKVFHLEYADAENAANLINEVFGEERNTGSNSNDRNQNMSFRGPGGRGGGGQQTSTSTSSAVSVVASADERTNSIVVSGPTDTLEVIADIIEELDANPEQERQLFIYQLKNAEADNLMQVLNNLFSQLQDLNTQGTTNNQRFQGQQGGGGNTGGTTDSTDLDEEVYFEADETTNSLVILTSSKNYEMIKPIIEELDEPVQQVLIKVLFAEVTHDNTIDLGTEFSILNIGAGGSIGQNFGLDAPSASEGIRFNWLDSNLEVTLRALQETGKLNVLSRPYILTSDNETANINVGEVVPFADGTTLSDGGTQSTTVDYRNVGIELEVTPSINPEGLVIMQINPTISETTGRTVQINEDLSAEVYAERSSVSKVAVRDGQTIVIGGLIEDTIKQTHSKVPLLGDIPGLGALFRRTIDQTVKTELLIFLTPTVADNDEELAAISDELGALNTIPFEGDLAKDPAYKRYIKTLPETAPEK